MGQRVYYYEEDHLKTKPSLARYGFALNHIDDKYIIDIGCGARKGPYILSGRAAQVMAMDISPQAIEYCQQNWPSEKINYLTGSATDIPVKDKTFDVAICFEVIEHVEDYLRVLEEVKRILKPQGLFIMSTPNKVVVGIDGRLSNPDHFKEFTLEELTKMLKAYFSGVVIYGQSPSSAVLEIEQVRRKSLKAVQKTPVFIKKIIPNRCKDFLINFYKHLRIKMHKGLDIERIDEADFSITSDNVEEARYFIAVCKN